MPNLPSQIRTIYCKTQYTSKCKSGGTYITGAIPHKNALPVDANKALFNRRLKSDFRLATSALIAVAFNEQLCRGLSE